MDQDCSRLLDCLTCVLSVLNCTYIDNGKLSSDWRCVKTTVGIGGIRMKITKHTTEYCPDTSTNVAVTIIDHESGIIGVIALCLAIFCFCGMCALVWWLKTPKARLSPQPATRAISELGAFAREREEERRRSRAAFERWNMEFQSELDERAERLRQQKNHFPPPPQNTPAPDSYQGSRFATREATPAINIPTRPHSPVAHYSGNPPNISRQQTPLPSTFASRSNTPIPTDSRANTPFSPPLPLIPENHDENTYDSPSSSLYESVNNSPNNIPMLPLPAIPQNSPQQGGSRLVSRYGRVIKQTSFYKSK